MSILDPNQGQVMSRMTSDAEDIIRQRIREYCVFNYPKYRRGELWTVANQDMRITKVDNDEKGWYVETRSDYNMRLMGRNAVESYYIQCLTKGTRIDVQKGFLIKDTGVYFRWHKHVGGLTIHSASGIESTDGLPEELDYLCLNYCCQDSEKISINNKIDVVVLLNIRNLQISGSGCKNVIIHPDYPYGCGGNITTPDGVKIHHPKDFNEYWDLLEKITKTQHAITPRLLK